MHAWCESAIRGAEEKVRAFVAGFVAGEPAPSEGVVFARDLGLALGERVRELAGTRCSRTRCFWSPTAGRRGGGRGRGGAMGLAVDSAAIVSATFFTTRDDVAINLRHPARLAGG